MKLETYLAAAILSVASVAPAFSATMYVHDSNGNLGQVDTSTGAVSVIGNMGSVMTDIAFDPTGNLYVIDFNNLYSVNSATGVSSLIGSLGVADMNALVFGTDGTLYSASNTNHNLYALNTATGAASSLGGTGFASGGDLAFSGGDLYLAATGNQLVRIDLADLSSSTAIGNFGVSSVFGLATAPDGTVYATAGTMIYSLDLLTGAAINGVSFGGQGLGSAFGQSFYTESGAAPVPVPASGLLLVGGIAVLGAARRRRNRARG